MNDGSNDYYYAHDHLYSSAALLDLSGSVVERYEYDAYGNPYILTSQYASRRTSQYGNPYLFTGRNVDFLDNGNLKLQYNRNRYYDYYIGRWFTQDPVGYNDGMNMYEYVTGRPTVSLDPYGLCMFIHDDSYKEGSTPPPDGDFAWGYWNVETPSPEKLKELKKIKNDFILAFTATNFVGYQPDASRHMLQFLGNTGRTIEVSYPIIIMTSEEAFKAAKKDLKGNPGTPRCA